LPPNEADELLLGVVKLFISDLKGVITPEPQAKAIHKSKILSNDNVLRNVLKGFLSPPPAEWLRTVFQVKSADHNSRIAQLKSECTERDGFSALCKYIQQLHGRNVGTASANDFPSPESYDKWLSKELEEMESFKREYLLRNPKLEMVSKFDLIILQLI
jgi:hypothetical protein